MRRICILFVALLVFPLDGCWGAGPLNEPAASVAQQTSFKRRPFSAEIDGRWIGKGISFGPYREGQAPGGKTPSREQLTEDLKLAAKHWSFIRTYGTREVASDVLQIIRKEKLPIRVMLGAWITREYVGKEGDEQRDEEAQKANRGEIANAIHLANAYPDLVLGVSVGNETQVYWSAHKCRQSVLIGYLQIVRGATKVPITTADDFNFWNKPESQAVAKEIDFIITHIHPHWAGNKIDQAVSWTKKIYAEVCQHHPDLEVVIGETGWATQVHDEGEQAKLIKGKAGEKQQKQFYDAFTKWAAKERIVSFYFELFDEPWKGGPHPNEVEKHWGLYKVDRKPKAAMAAPVAAATE